MLKAIHKMMNKPVKLTLIDHEFSSIEWMGGGIEESQPASVLIFHGLDTHWLAVEWQHSGEFVIIPAADVVCIASDLVK